MTFAKLPSTTALLLNGGAILIAVASGVAVLRSAFLTPRVPPCSETYQGGIRLSLDNNGTGLSASELQGRLGNTDWGLANGARVVKLKSGPTQHALEFNLASAPAADAPANGQNRPGIGFIWTPDQMGRVQAACLAYSVFIPDGFAFGKGGRLPGLMGSGSIATHNDRDRLALASLVTWDPAGRFDIYPQFSNWPEGRPLANDYAGRTLDRGKWVKIEQEAVLNTIGQKDGVLRAWINGNLAFQRTDISLRDRPSVMISGVLAEAVAGAKVADTVGNGPQKLWISPLQLQWQ